MGRLIDISPAISSDLAVWPGDVPFSRKVSADMRRGDNLTLSAITATVHLGAHVDAPSHYTRDGAAIAERSLELYYGPCQVMGVRLPRGERILPEHLPARVTRPRLLLRTGSYPDPSRFNTDFNSLSPELVDALHAAGVRLVGIDTPSVDPYADRELRAHGAVARHDMAVLEGVALNAVADGFYTLVALPLPIVGADASPVRAALVVE